MMPGQALSGYLKSVFHEVQGFSLLSWSAVRKIFSHPFYYREFAIQMDKIGVGSLFIITLTGVFPGMVMALQFLAQLKPFAATSYVGGMVANGLSFLSAPRSARHSIFSPSPLNEASVCLAAGSFLALRP